MNKVIKTIGLAALLAATGCEYEEASTAKKEKTEITIPSGECVSICGGEICYGNIVHWKLDNMGRKKILERYVEAGGNQTEADGYTIEAEGFWYFRHTGKKMIFADECVFYRKSFDAEKLVLEKLR